MLSKKECSYYCTLFPPKKRDKIPYFRYSHATLIGTPCVLPLEGPIIWKVPLTEKALSVSMFILLEGTS